jgi:hypothetical protein
MDDDDPGRRPELSNRREITGEVVCDTAINAWVDTVGEPDLEDGVAVRRRFRCDLGADVARCACPVLDDHLLTEHLGQSGRNGAPDGVGARAGGSRNKITNGFDGIALRASVDCKDDQADKRKPSH